MFCNNLVSCIYYLNLRIDRDFLLKVEVSKASEFICLKDTIPNLTILS